jgi:hypothetical protein
VLGCQYRHALGATLPAQKALTVIESLEKKFQVIKWSAHCVETQLATASDTTSVIKTKPGFFDSQIVFDSVGRRYRIEMKQVSEWINGDAPWMGMVSGFSFDGEVYRGWERQKHGMELPSEQDRPAFGDISKNRNEQPSREDLVDFGCTATGLGYMPPYFWDGGESPNQPLSRLLRKWLDERRDVSVVENGNGAWTIATRVRYGALDGCHLRIRYDPTKGGVVTGAQWVVVEKGHDYENARLDIELQKVADGIWVPKTARRISCLNRPPDMVVTSFEGIEVNPSVGTTTFQMEFPKGTRVSDHIRKMYYVAGTDVDQQLAIQAFMERYNITGNVPPFKMSLSLGRAVALVVSLVLVILMIAILAVHRWKRKHAR